MPCAKCFQGTVHDHATPTGHLEQLHGYKTYITGDTEATSASVIIYLPDFFSHKLINNKLLADRYAQGTGCKVLFPDIVPSGGVDPSYFPAFEKLMAPESSIFTKIWSFIQILPIVPMFITAGAAKVFPEVLKYARAVRKELPEGAKLGVAGFCWGGYMSVNLCGQADVQGGSKRLIDASFSGHPSALKTPDNVVDAVSKFDVPVSIAAAEIDPMYGEKVADETEAVLREKCKVQVDGGGWEQKVYKGAKHGFCVRANPEDKADTDGYHAAAKQAIDWYNKHLK